MSAGRVGAAPQVAGLAVEDLNFWPGDEHDLGAAVVVEVGDGGAAVAAGAAAL